ncbi:MAG: UbiA family prenyltransferase [Patescibacteria group bacterium]
MWYLTYKLIRPVLPISGGLAAWIVSQACGADFRSSLAAALTMALSTVGASFYHYGGANWMYARKSERLKFKDPQVVMLAGLVIFCASVFIAVQWLPKQCVYIALFNTIAVAAYSAKLSSHWLTKNLTMSLVCATPVAIGWQAGSFTHPLVPWALAIAALAHLSREMIKDVKDIIANNGRRVTLPMVLGTDKVLQIAGSLLLIVGAMMLSLLRFTGNLFQQSMVAIAVILFILTAWHLIYRKQASRSETVITVALFCVLLALA